MAGKFGDDVAKAAGKAATSGGDEAIDGVRAGWKLGGEEVAGEAVGKSQTAARELIESNLPEQFAGDFALRIRRQLNNFYEHLSGFEAQADAIVKGHSKALKSVDSINNRNIVDIVSAKSFSTGTGHTISIPESIIATGDVNAIKQYIKQSLSATFGNVDQAKANLYFAERARNVLNQENGLFKFRQLLGKDKTAHQGFYASGLESKIPGFKNLIDDASDVLKYDASKLGDTKFIQKTLLMKSDNPEMFKLFIANPKNYSRWQKFKMNPGYVGTLIEKGSPRIPFKRRIIGITPAETAKRLGLGGVIGATGIVGLYHWLGNNDPAIIAGNSGSLRASIQSIRPRGEGGKILAQANASLGKIDSIAKEVDQKLSTDEAPAAISMYITGISRELKTLTDALNKWDIVVQNSDNQELAKREGQKLEAFVGKRTNGFYRLSKQLGISMEAGIAGKVAPKGVTSGADSDNLMKIQGFLQLNKTGRLDRSTVQALRNLENTFNNRAKTTEFTGTFVVPKVGHVITYDNLVIAYQKIQKY